MDVLADEKLRSSLKEYSVRFFLLIFFNFSPGSEASRDFWRSALEEKEEKTHPLFSLSTCKNKTQKHLKKAWPTFPQVYISGSFFGGCDIMIESYQSGELVEVLETALSE